MRILVCGGRDFTDRARVFQVLDEYDGDMKCVVSGAAAGADTLGADWAREKGIALALFPANWNAHFRSAGPIRNKWMIEHGQPDLVIAFPGGRGTDNMVQQATEAGIPVRRVSA